MNLPQFMIKYSEEVDQSEVIEDNSTNQDGQNINNVNNTNSSTNNNSVSQINKKDLPWFHPYFFLLGSFNSVS